MREKSLRLKIGIYLAIALTVAMLMFTTLVIQNQRARLLAAAEDYVSHLSAVITRSTRYAMLQNRPDYVSKIFQDVGSEGGIEKIRLLSKEGKVIHSTYLPEIGQVLDQNAEACILCHQSKDSLEQIPGRARSRVYSNPEGRRLLGSMEVIRNEPSCYTAACHEHSKNQSVLGVLDIVYSLDNIDRTMRSNTTIIAGFSLGFIALVSIFVSLFVHRLVYVPLRDIKTGAERVSTGNLDELIPVRSQDEFGKLATSFNSMTVALRKSQTELKEWGDTLAQKVATRTEELRIAEAEAVRGEKLASVGLLAAGIAHELNNPLTGVLTFSHLLRKKMTDGSQEAEDLDLVIRETKRCAVIIRRLLDFARDKPPEKNFADINQIIRETERIIDRPASLHNVEISLELDPSLPPVWVDADLFKQLIMNMLVNAQHAVERGGSITVRSRRFPEPRSPVPGMKPVPMVEISIIDTGCGIPVKDLQRIFDPFFTTKEVGKGTGLGLSVSHGIVRAHGGTIEVESKVGEGTTFRVYLPIDPPFESAENASSRSNA